MKYHILARNGSHGDFVNIHIEAKSWAGALSKLRAFGRANGFHSLKALTMEVENDC
jgi:hypothetical protein